MHIILAITNSVNGVAIETLEYAYDALVRPISRNADTFGYNDRSEVVFSHGATENTEYSYDGIGNLLASTSGGITNTYTANCLNQYTSISNLCASMPPCELSYDSDGNLLSDGVFTYAYDAGNRLLSVTSAMLTNGAIRVVNAYDAQGRRIRKTVQRLHSTTPPPPSPPTGTQEWQSVETRTFAWDGNNIVLESIGFADGSTRICEYFWGNDKSGTEQGAGGVGGLLAVSVSDSQPTNSPTPPLTNSQYFIPCYDHNGNIVRYVSDAGATAAQYLYDPYGNMVEASGPLADQFSFGFSTKYHDRETGLVAYQQRFYHPPNSRWLNRDPIEEEGGLNLYAFCGNNAICKYDKDGCAYFIKRKLDYVPWINYFAQNADRDVRNREAVHEQLIFEDNDTPSDIGYFGDSKTKSDPNWKNAKWVRVPGRYNDCVMRKAVEQVKPLPYSLFGDEEKGISQYNCQDYADALRSKYSELIKDKKVRCECGLPVPKSK